MSSTLERRPKWSASSTSAERITVAIISWRSVISSKVSRIVSSSSKGKLLDQSLFEGAVMLEFGVYQDCHEIRSYLLVHNTIN